MKAFNYFLIFSFFSPFVTFASVITPTTNCDTLISAEGRVILVEIVDITNSSIRFRLCGDNSVPYMELPRSAVREIRPFVNKPKAVLRETIPTPLVRNSAGKFSLCDTLISAEGRVILVEIVDITNSSIRFRLCGDNSVPYMELPRSAVREIRPNFNKEDLIDLSPEEEIQLTQRARAAAIWGWAPLILSPILFLAGLWFLLIPLEIFGFIFTVRILRKIPKSKKYRNQWNLAIFGLIGSTGIALSILLILLVIYQWSRSV